MNLLIPVRAPMYREVFWLGPNICYQKTKISWIPCKGLHIILRKRASEICQQSYWANLRTIAEITDIKLLTWQNRVSKTHGLMDACQRKIY